MHATHLSVPCLLRMDKNLQPVHQSAEYRQASGSLEWILRLTMDQRPHRISEGRAIAYAWIFRRRDLVVKRCNVVMYEFKTSRM